MASLTDYNTVQQCSTVFPQRPAELTLEKVHYARKTINTNQNYCTEPSIPIYILLGMCEISIITHRVVVQTGRFLATYVWLLRSLLTKFTVQFILAHPVYFIRSIMSPTFGIMQRATTLIIIQSLISINQSSNQSHTDITH